MLKLLDRCALQAAFALRKMDLNKAKKYLEDVMSHKRAVPFRRYAGSTGRTAQAKNEDAPAGVARWPVKSAEFLLNLLKNAESNAEVRWVCHVHACMPHLCMAPCIEQGGALGA
jgi:ribosomal protein uL22